MFTLNSASAEQATNAVILDQSNLDDSASSSSEEESADNITSDLDDSFSDPNYVAGLESSESESGDAGSLPGVDEDHELAAAIGQDDSDGEEANLPDWIDIVANVPAIPFSGDPGVKIQPQKSGPGGSLTAYDTWELFVTDEVLHYITDETNRFAQQYIRSHNITRSSVVNHWKATTVHELEKFFGVVIAMGIVRMPELRYYWSKDALYGNKLVKAAMSRTRFELLLKFLHFVDSETAPPGDRLYKVRTLIDLLVRQFKTVYVPAESVVIDETMIPWRGRLIFRQYIPGKHHTYGVKAYKLCTPEAYTWNLSIYTGRDVVDQGLGHADAVVMSLMDCLLFEDRTLFQDNFYNSVALSTRLLSRGTYVCGTLRQRRKGNPKLLMDQKIQRGQVVGKEQSGTKVIKWVDKRPVVMITTRPDHDATLRATGRKNRQGVDILKPR